MSTAVESPKERIVALLRMEPELSCRSVAKRLDLPESSIRKLVQAARADITSKGDSMASSVELATVAASSLKVVPPFSDLFPINPTTLKAIVDSLAGEGFHASKPIEVWQRGDDVIVIDGHTRRQAAIEVGVDVPIYFLEFEDEDEALEHAIANQRDRRNLTDKEIARCVIALDKRKVRGGDRKSVDAKSKRSSDLFDSDSETSRERTAKLVGTSETKVKKVREVMSQADEATKQAVLDGTTSINKAAKKVRAKRAASKPKSEPKPAPAARQREPGDDDEDIPDEVDPTSNGHANGEMAGEAIEEDEDTKYLNSIPARKLLSDRFRAVFDYEALAYRKAEEYIRGLKNVKSKLFPKSRHATDHGPFEAKLFSFFSNLCEPHSWLKCGSCQDGRRGPERSECGSCHGVGFVMPTYKPKDLQ